MHIISYKFCCSQKNPSLITIHPTNILLSRLNKNKPFHLLFKIIIIPKYISSYSLAQSISTEAKKVPDVGFSILVDILGLSHTANMNICTRQY